MYDKEMISRAILSPFTSNLTNEIARQELIEGYKEGVRSMIVAPGQVDLINELEEEYGNGYTRKGMVIGYPYGGLSRNFKVYLAKYAVEKGLHEVDIGVNITAIKSGDFKTARDELEEILAVTKDKVNVIPLLWIVRIPLELVDKICKMYIDIGITSIKTNPGIHFGDMKVDHVAYLSKHFGDKLEIEVAGRVRSREKAEEMVAAGATYFHISQWKRISGIGKDIQFDWDTKIAAPGQYIDRM